MSKYPVSIFRWGMTEEDYAAFQRSLKEGIKDDNTYMGGVAVGRVFIEFVLIEKSEETGNPEDNGVFTFYTNCYEAGKADDDAYMCLEDGTPYMLLNDELNRANIDTEGTYAEFKCTVEAEVMRLYDTNAYWHDMVEDTSEPKWKGV